MISTLRFLIDESAGKKIAEALLKDGHDVKLVYDVMLGAPDLKVLEFAEREQRIVITNDKGFGELVFRLGRPNSGVILLRLYKDSPQNRIKTTLTLTENLKEDLYKHFVVASEVEFRIRKPQGIST